MRLLSFFILIFFNCAAASAIQVKVVELKGKQAVIELSSENLIHVGDYNLLDTSAKLPNTREYTINVSSGYYKVSSITNLSFSTSFGWNRENFEIGPIITYQSIDNSDASFYLGLFFDYNVIPNKLGNNFTYGPTVTINSGSITPNGGDAYSSTTGFVGAFLKWFVFGNDTCLRLDIGSFTQRQSFEGNIVNTYATKGNIALQTYF